GTATVTGAGSRWDIVGGGANIGRGSDGTLDVTNGAIVTCSNTSLVGDSAGITGQLTVRGVDAAWSGQGDLIVGNNGSGAFTVDQGAHATTAAWGYVGRYGNGNSSATIDGAGSKWTVGGQFQVGDSDTS